MIVGLLALFEDEGAGRFEPAALTRSVAGLRLGAWTHRERWERLFPDRDAALVCRGAVADVERANGAWHAVNDLPAQDIVFVAAAIGRVTEPVRRSIRSLEPGEALVAEGRLLAARAAGDAAIRLTAHLREMAGGGFFGDKGGAGGDAESWLKALNFRIREIEASWPRTLADLIAANAAAIEEDAAAYQTLLPAPVLRSHPSAHLIRPEHIRFGERVWIDPGVVLDASEGPILLGPRTRVMAGSVLTGPVAIGADCRVRPLARIESASLGPQCRIGGEVSGSIVIGFSNKQHDGFLGHSYLGAWVNLGAATDTSDLKNDYGPVRVTVAGETIDTGERHVGSFIGDHTKTAIHTRLNTGSVIGVASNILGADFSPKVVPSFCWGGDGEWSEYRIDKAVEVARIVMPRRGATLAPADEALLRALHAATSADRAHFLRS